MRPPCASCLQKMVRAAAKRNALSDLKALGSSERRVYEPAGANRKMVRYRLRRPPEEALRARLRELAYERRRFGYRRWFVLQRREDEASYIRRQASNACTRFIAKQVCRCASDSLAARPSARARPMLVEAKANARWSVDSVHDQFANG